MLAELVKHLVGAGGLLGQVAEPIWMRSGLLADCSLR